MMDTNHYIQKEKTVETMEKLYEKAKEQNLTQRHGDRRIQEACLKIAARKNQEMVKNIQDLEHYNRRGLDKSVRAISRKLDAYPPQYKPKVYLEQFKQSVEPEILEKAEEILEQAENIQELVGRSTTAQAAAAVYIAAVLTDNYMPNDEIVEIGDVSEPTLRKTYRTMIEELDLVDEILDKHPYPTRTRWSNK